MPDRYDGASLLRSANENLVYKLNQWVMDLKNIDDIKTVLIIVFLLTKTLLKIS
jgi:hypothetical protein